MTVQSRILSEFIKKKNTYKMSLKIHSSKFIAVGILFLFLFCSSVHAESGMGLFKSYSQKYQKVKVVKVIKADLFELESGEKIQLIGLNAPEPPDDMYERFVRTETGLVMERRAEDPRYSVAERSYIFASDLLTDQYVRLEFDVEKNDKNYNTLAYAFSLEDGTLLNAEILRQGYANLRIRPPNMKYADKLREAYREAKKNFRGLQGE